MRRPSLGIASDASIRQTKGRIGKPVPALRRCSVSVVIPCYNYGHYLAQCVESVVSQPGVDLEIIIVDDKSTDNSLDVALSLQQRHPGIKVIAHEKNKGHIATYNDGLALVTGEFLLLLSADDLVTPGALTRAVALMTAEPSVGLVYGNAIEFSSGVPTGRNADESWIVWQGVDWLKERCRAGYNVVPCPAAVMRTSVFRDIGGYRADLPHAGDFEMWLRVSAVSDIGFIAGVDQACYRVHGSNMHKSRFNAGTAKGGLIDLVQRWQSFEAVLGEAEDHLGNRASLLHLARQTLAQSALESVCYAYARGVRDFPIEDYEALAFQISPEVVGTQSARVLARRKKTGMASLPLRPLWAISIFGYYVRRRFLDRRRRAVGI